MEAKLLMASSPVFHSAPHVSNSRPNYLLPLKAMQSNSFACLNSSLPKKPNLSVQAASTSIGYKHSNPFALTCWVLWFSMFVLLWICWLFCFLWDFYVYAAFVLFFFFPGNWHAFIFSVHVLSNYANCSVTPIHINCIDCAKILFWNRIPVLDCFG